MEAVWTRFFPVTIAFQEAISTGKIGEVERVFSDFSQDFDLPSELRKRGEGRGMGDGGERVRERDAYLLRFIGWWFGRPRSCF